MAPGKDTVDKFLEELADMPWRQHRTVRSESAEHVPMLIRAVIQTNSEDALANLEDELFHQGWRPGAAVVAAPIICRMLSLVSLRLRIRLIDLLVHIAVGFEDECLGSAGIKGTDCSYNPLAYRSVAAESSLVIPLVSKGNTEEVLSACRFLAWFPHLAEQTLPLLRSLCLCGSENEQVAAYVARGLLKDSVEVNGSNIARVKYASTIAHCETEIMTSANLAVFIEMSRWKLQKEAAEPLGDWRNDPYGFTLGLYASEVLKRSDTLKDFQRNAAPGPMLDLTYQKNPG